MLNRLQMQSVNVCVQQNALEHLHSLGAHMQDNADGKCKREVYSTPMHEHTHTGAYTECQTAMKTSIKPPTTSNLH